MQGNTNKAFLYPLMGPAEADRIDFELENDDWYV
jgi:hypothetical protein